MSTSAGARPGLYLTDLPGRVVLGLLAAAVPIAFISMGAHDFALVKLGVPFPDESGVPSLVRLAGQVVRIVGLVALCRCAVEFLSKRSTLVACLIMGLVNAALGETLRVLIIQTQVFGGSSPDFLFSVLDLAPGDLLSFYQGCVAALIARMQVRLISAKTAFGIVTAAVFGLHGLTPGLKAASTAMATWLHLASPKVLYPPPYDFHIYKYIYPTFLEPTLASIFLASIVWPGLPRGPFRRVVIYVGLLILARGRVFAEFVNVFWLRFPLPIGFAAEGQFLIETLLMATLTGAAWGLSLSRAPDGRLRHRSGRADR